MVSALRRRPRSAGTSPAAAARTITETRGFPPARGGKVTSACLCSRGRAPRGPRSRHQKIRKKFAGIGQTAQNATQGAGHDPIEGPAAGEAFNEIARLAPRSRRAPEARHLAPPRAPLALQCPAELPLARDPHGDHLRSSEKIQNACDAGMRRRESASLELFFSPSKTEANAASPREFSRHAPARRARSPPPVKSRSRAIDDLAFSKLDLDSRTKLATPPEPSQWVVSSAPSRRGGLRWRGRDAP
jgi:hypothetical protein